MHCHDIPDPTQASSTATGPTSCPSPTDADSAAISEPSKLITLCRDATAARIRYITWHRLMATMIAPAVAVLTIDAQHVMSLATRHIGTERNRRHIDHGTGDRHGF